MSLKFWTNVDKSGPIHPKWGRCWAWKGGKTGSGYGWIHGMGAHRYSYKLHFKILPRQQFVLHRCDNPVCVNPKHLFLGTNEENIQDMVTKNRQRSAQQFDETNGMAKLTRADKEEICRRYAAGGISQHRLAAEFNVAQSRICAAIHRGRRIIRKNTPE